MGTAKPVILSNGRRWETRKAAKAYFKEMLSRYRVGDRVTDPEDEANLSALLHLYDSVLSEGQNTKIGLGIDHFMVKRNVGVENGFSFSTPGFHVFRVDGTSVDFSFYDAVDTEPPQV